MTFNNRIKSWMGILGIFGFLGLLYFKFYEPSHLMFLGFFAFFSFFILGKHSNKKRDEKFICNQNKASNFSLKIFMVIVFCGMIFMEVYPQIYHYLGIKNKYAFIIALISIAYAITWNLFAFKFHKYETKALAN